MAWLVGLVLLIAGIIWFLSSRRRGVARTVKRVDRSGRSSGGRSSLNVLRGSGNFWGVRIELASPAHACAAVHEYADKQLLINHAPELPLADCTAAVCQCHYVGLEERRVGPRRTGEDRREGVRFEDGKVDRRQGDRRKRAGWDKQHEQF
ncbi:MAG: hypothetical protein J4A00_10775 [Gammaproteobacteria bacterium]|nr:hypothetical protein [Gammaproteobacteria bacterium]